MFRSSRVKTSQLAGYLFVAPAFALVCAFSLYPILRSIFLSFFHWDMVTAAPKFIGLNNYIRLFTSGEFYQSVWVTIEYSIGFIPLSMLFGLLLAACLTGNTRVNYFYRAVFFAPTVTSMVAMSAVWLYIFHPQYGTLNDLLRIFHLGPVRWLNSPATALWSLVMMHIWSSVGFCTVLYLAALVNVPHEVLEAAQIDGADRRQMLWYIRLPLVSPTTFMLAILQTISSFKTFTEINVMTGGGPAGSTTNLVTYMYHEAFASFQVGYGSAIAVVFLVLILCVYFIQRWFERFVYYA